MTTLAHKATPFETRDGHARTRETAPHQCMLRATEHGWALLGPDGKLLFRGLGQSSRIECLRFARSLGVLTVDS